MSISHALSTVLSPSCIFPDSHNNSETVSVTVPVLQTMELKPREVEWFIQGYTASQLLHQHFNSGLPDLKVWSSAKGEREGREEGKNDYFLSASNFCMYCCILLCSPVQCSCPIKSSP